MPPEPGGLQEAIQNARRRLSDAMHAMHADQRILIDSERAHELSEAWDAFEAVLTDRPLMPPEPMSSTERDTVASLRMSINWQNAVITARDTKIASLQAQLAAQCAVVKAARKVRAEGHRDACKRTSGRCKCGYLDLAQALFRLDAAAAADVPRETTGQ